ncbi:MAG: SDR family oxidoreductase [Chloroflexi bacterium]|uniref:SDR family oxidoreductase n=1 Tax=Candidatus Chlorohelix allophototropha TaxID=3003348 RepID=A0A8T7LZC6_9CHLR|nr:SDR family oxidoreductase [Chloroflexota bacterium]WJW65738.1 SDR family oxidoreductase [Chloroflexota bacterium L227-S17]
MRIVIFGATGKTGNALLSKTLSQGHQVTALVRDVSKINIITSNLKVIQGDVLDKVAVQTAISGQDVVFCTLGTGLDLSPTTVLSNGTRNIVEAMQAHRVKRIVCLLSGWLFYPTYPPIFKNITEEHARQLEILKKSGLEWVAVCPPQITDDPGDQPFRVAMGSLPLGATNISKEDVARFMIAQLKQDFYLGETVGIAY